MKKILYLITYHTNPDKVVRLVKTIKTGSPESKVLIHHYSSSNLSSAAFEQMSHVHILENYIPFVWEDFSRVRMETLIPISKLDHFTG
jgi:hypothetical protein